KILDPIFALGLSTFIMSSGFSLLAAIEPQINQRFDQGAFMFALEFSAMVGMLAITQPIVGSLSDKYGRKRFILTGLILLGPITFLQGLSVESWQLIVTRLLQGISGAMVLAPALALAGDLTENGQSGSKLSILTVAFGIGISFGSFMSGFTVQFGFLVPFAIGAVLALIGALLVYTQVPNK
ncbi:MAG TPA: MFS transporter, partial [Balneolaceae bacterium]|nr:MFS transporter [Balneolaceae bacterium]